MVLYSYLHIGTVAHVVVIVIVIFIKIAVIFVNKKFYLLIFEFMVVLSDALLSPVYKL